MAIALPKKMMRSEAFQLACARNALRREGRLPLLSMVVAVEEELRRNALQIYGAAWEAYRMDHERIRAEVIAELRRERGPEFGMSAGGRWIVGMHTSRRYEGLLASKGYVRPTTRMTIYGGGRLPPVGRG